MVIQQTFVLIKPDGVARGLIGEIIKRFEQRGFKIVALKLVQVNKDFAKMHYTEEIEKRRGKQVREALLDYVTSGPVVAMVVEGVDAIENVRKLVGSTESKSSLPGTIRGDYSHVSFDYADQNHLPVRNVVHASSDKADAINEISLWFSIDEFFSYRLSSEEYLYN
ncbi:MAG: nucleoside-diphosphate kinase [Candidatus Nanoarchaeia archaeon]|jgi:nucleoside-diphosphate kinase|nr:nucleoside-diphosphate kinase [Candidatus Nanoarchaeia archaeon]MDD4563603.1 nucleoside-diphosphate kinase [Candidatus Nanoarchaeia archaeon]